MSLKQFKDMVDGEVFSKNGTQFKKIPLVRVSCCKSINAQQVDDPNNRVYMQPSQEVEINDQQQ